MKLSSLLTATILLILFTATSPSSQSEKQDYLADLLKQQQNIEKALNEILQIDDNLSNNLKLSQNDVYQTNVIESAIENYQSLTLDAYANTFLPLKMKTWECQNISKDHYNQIQNQIVQLEKQLNSLKQVNDKLQYCQRNEVLNIQKELLNKTIEGLKKEITESCSTPVTVVPFFTNVPFLDTKESKFLPNRNVTAPWVYGNMTESQYAGKANSLKYIFSAAPCPESAPFLNINNQCFSCNSPDIYDISQKACNKCQIGKVYDPITHSCIIGFLQFNSNMEKTFNYFGTPSLADSSLQTCLASEPFFDGKHCLSCSLPSFFDFNTKTCTNCGNFSIFDITQRKCKQVTFYKSFIKNDSNYIGIPLTAQAQSYERTCPQSAPFSNGSTCFVCQLPRFFNFQRMECQLCPTDLFFDNVTHSCIGAAGSVTFINSNIIKSRNFIGHVPLFSQLYKNCPQDHPYFNSKQCISCDLPSYFNFDSSTCENCPTGLTFNTIIQTCEYVAQSFYTNINNANIYYNGDFETVNKVINDSKSKNKDIKECPLNLPFYDSRVNSCINCGGALPLFDFKKNMCMQCPSGSYFKPENHICLTSSVPATIQRMIMNSK